MIGNYYYKFVNKLIFKKLLNNLKLDTYLFKQLFGSKTYSTSLKLGINYLFKQLYCCHVGPTVQAPPQTHQPKAHKIVFNFDFIL